MAHEQIAQISCAENISFLSLLHHVPTQPKSNPLKSLSASPGYTLPFDRERSLASVLAFLSSIRDDPNHIPAVCIGEVPDSGCLNVFLAVNKSRCSDGDDILRDLKRGFEQIFLTLATSFDEQCDASDLEREVFTAIVCMCSSRILSRLRLAPTARKASKINIKDGLLEAINSAKRLNHSNIKDPRMISIAASFVTTAKEVIKLVDSWRKHQTPARLENLIESVHRLHQAGIGNVLDLIPNRDMDPSLRASLVNMVGKVARYRQAARFLFRTAKKSPIVRQTRIVPVNLPQEAFQRFRSDQYEPELLSAISRMVPKYAKARNLNQIWRLLQTSESEVAGQFSEQTQKILQEAKIHAEIQLIFHCELQLPMNLPRVICSSKDACYLCSIFISMHGRFYTPRCHGRLYPGWRLPFLPQLGCLQQEFNQSLERKIKESLDTLLSRQERTIYPYPNESTLLTLPTSISTLESLPHPQIVTLDAQLTEHRSSGGNTSLIPSSSTRSSEGGLDTIEVDCAVQAMIGSFAKDISSSNRLISTDLSTSSDHTRGYIYSLSRGIVLTKSIKASCKSSPLYTAGPLEVQIEYNIDSRQMSACPTGLPYSIEWLTNEGAEMEEEKCHSGCVIDAESLQGETLHAMCNDKSLYIVARGSALRLRFH